MPTSITYEQIKEIVLSILKERVSTETDSVRADLEPFFVKLAELTAHFTLKQVEGQDSEFYLNLLKETAKSLGAILLHRTTNFTWQTFLEIALTVAKTVAKVML
jgi:hypothetical protein